MAINWTEDLKTGVDEIDEQHQTMFKQITTLMSAADKPHAYRVARATVDALKLHARDHFAFEERIMLATGFPGLAAHRHEHEQIAEYVEGFSEDLDARGAEPELLMVATRVLGNWLVTHTRSFDRDLATFLRLNPAPALAATP